MRRFRKPDGYDDEGNPYVFLRRVRFPRLNRLRNKLDRSMGFWLYWRWRLLGWLVCGGIAAWINPWLIPIAILVFEAVILAMSLRAGRRVSRYNVTLDDSDEQP